MRIRLLALGALLTLSVGVSVGTASAQAADKRPDFSSPVVADATLKVDGLPEKVTWYTSKPGVWGSPRAKQGGTYHSYIGEFPSTFRNIGPNSNGEGASLFRTNPSLVDLNGETKEWIPLLATDWAYSADGKTMYFKLNEKAKWSDGNPVTADDYVFMFQMMTNPNIQDPYVKEYFTTQIVDVKKLGPWVISVTAGTAMGKDDLLNTVNTSPRPSKFYGGTIPEDYADAYQWKFEPTAGPYYLASFEKDESLTFQKVKDWWGYAYDYNKYRFNFDTLQYKVITGGDEVIKNYFYKGQLDEFALLRPPVWATESVSEPVKKGYIDLQWFYFVPNQGLSGIVLNTKAPIFSDVNVRQGLYYAINIQKMIDTALRGEYSRFHNIGIGHVFAGVNFDNDAIRKPNFDPAKAAALFAKAGYTTRGSDGILKNAKGDRLSFELLYQTPAHTERISVLKEEAKKAGLEIVLKLQQQGAFDAVLEKHFEAFWAGMTDSLQPDYWQYFHSDNANKTQTNNFWGYANPGMDKLLDAFRAESDLKKKAALDKQIQTLVDKEALVIPNYYVPFFRSGTWKWIQYPSWLGLRYDDSYYWVQESGYGSAMGYQWFDPDLKKQVTDAQKAGKALTPVLTKVETFKAK